MKIFESTPMVKMPPLNTVLYTVWIPGCMQKLIPLDCGLYGPLRILMYTINAHEFHYSLHSLDYCLRKECSYIHTT